MIHSSSSLNRSDLAALAAGGTAHTLQGAAGDFEQFLLKGMLDRMLSTLGEGGIFESDNTGARFFQSLFSEEIARSWSEGGEPGVSRMLLKDLGQADPLEGTPVDLAALRLGSVARRPRVDHTMAGLQTMARDSASVAGLDEDWVCAIIACESDWNPRARSSKGAQGLMQLMPATAEELGVRDPWNPRENIEGGVRYLRQLLDRFGNDRTLAAAAYNAGPGAVERYGGVPPFPETRTYVERIEARMEERRREP